MLRIIKIAFLVIVLALLITVSLANRQEVALVLFPPEIGDLLGFNWTIAGPAFLVVLGSVALGLLIGFVWEWLREANYRREMDKRQRQVKSMRKELNKAKKAGNVPPEDDVLALLDKPAKSL